MTELGSNARGLIELARHEDDPDDGARERLQEAFRARLNASLAAADKSGVESLDRSGSRYQAAKSLVGSKSVLALAVVVASVGAGRLLNSKDAPAVAAGSARSVASVPAPAPVTATSSRSGLGTSGSDLGAARASSEREAAPQQGSTASQALEPSLAGRASEPRERMKIRPEPGPAVPTQPSALDASARLERDRSDLEPPAGSDTKPAAPQAEALLAEARALREVQQVLRSGNSARALTLLAEQERQFPHGQLGEARAAARAMALCSDQSLATRRRSMAAFEARWPRSILLSSVRGACGSSKE
jgi:hypothetical protein